MSTFKDFLRSVEYDNFEEVKTILKEGKVNPNDQDNEAIKVAVEYSYVEITKMLLDDPRVFNSVDYENLIEIAKNRSKFVLKIVEEAYNRYKIRQKNLEIKKTSPVEYKSVRKIMKPFLFGANIIDYLEKELENVKIEIFQVEDLKKSFGYDFKPIISIFPKQNIVESKEFKTFLCDFELFNWGMESEDIYKHRTRFDISYHMIYPLYTNYLARMLGNDLTLFSLNTSSVYQTIDEKALIKLGIKGFFDKENCKNRVLNFPSLRIIDLYYLTDPLQLYGFENYRYYETIKIEEFKTICKGKKKETFLYNFNYCDSIVKEKNTRYSLTNCIMKYDRRGFHYTFLFVDHRDKIVEYYDPYVILNKTECNLFIYKSLQEIFKGYKVNKFWESLSIQKTEEYEKDEIAFCVKWGHMMIHLKLLNINMNIIDIEKRFISECASKKLSLYEVMLNYTYLMRRIIPKDSYKFVKLRKLLI
jgi:hypothetical protein